ncbi:hypothetical protein, partial [Pseudomonas botevensis]|uniref:hypothetical protein n=1 Tax=Pseudomonas botevensis TaxID=2842352 RepID=UPI001C3E0B63
LPFWRLKKVTRRKGETASRNTRSNGYSPNPDKSLAGPEAAKKPKLTAPSVSSHPPDPQTGL